MDRTQQLYYEMKFRVQWRDARRDAFQRLFEQLMSKRYPGDFMACKPWGRQGDEKNDGYLPSARILFQVYGPEEMSSARTVEKVETDFAGASNHWAKYFDRWVFVHNAEALPPDVIKTLLRLRAANPRIDIEQWGYEELLIEFRGLKLADLESWFGVAFSADDRAKVGFAELQAVIEHVKFAMPLPSAAPRQVPPGKIEFNQLSAEVASFIKIGMEKVPLVEAFFAGWRDPLFGSRIAAAFTERYAVLRDTQPPLHPDTLWGELEDWAGVNGTKHPREKAAILATLAWLFGNCDIFDEPPRTQPALAT